MARIVEKSIDVWGIQEECDKCHSLIHYDQDDLVWSAGGSDQRDGTSWPGYFHVKCPVDHCYGTKRIDEDDLPPLVAIKAKRSRLVRQ